jgi:hypothetical protein
MIRFQTTIPVKTTFAPRNTRARLERAHPKAISRTNTLANITCHRADGHEHVNQWIVFDASQSQRDNGRCRIGGLEKKRTPCSTVKEWIKLRAGLTEREFTKILGWLGRV